MDYLEWSRLSYSKKNQHLLQTQKEVLRKFLDRNAISREQYEKSLRFLMEKMQET